MGGFGTAWTSSDVVPGDPQPGPDNSTGAAPVESDVDVDNLLGQYQQDVVAVATVCNVILLAVWIYMEAG